MMKHKYNDYGCEKGGFLHGAGLLQTYVSALFWASSVQRKPDLTL